MATKTKTKAKRKGRSLAFHKAAEVRRINFDGLPIVDAEADFLVQVRSSDIVAAKGNAKDPANCALAKACARQWGASTVAFFRRTAYIDLPDPNGKRSVHRFILSPEAAAVVSAFDRGKAVKGEVTVRLNAPTPSQKLDSIRKVSQGSKARRRQALLKGEIFGDLTKARFATNPRIADLDVRNGSGRVQNRVVKAS